MAGKYVGLSLSRCIQDILDGYVSIEEVEKIIARTAAPDEATWDSVLYDYATYKWQKDPERGIAIARQLLAENKIEQPRLQDPGFKHDVDILTGIWMEDGKQVSHSTIRSSKGE